MSKPDNANAMLCVHYSALAFRNAKAVQLSLDAKLDRTLTKATEHLLKQTSRSPLQTIRTVAALELSPTPIVDETFKATLAQRQLVGDDLVVLASFAARRRGGEIWKTFQEEIAQTIASQQLSGKVVVLVNRLAQARVASASKK